MIWHPSIKRILHHSPRLHQLSRSPCLEVLRLWWALEKNPPDHPSRRIKFLQRQQRIALLQCWRAVRITPTCSRLKNQHLCTVFEPIVNLTVPIQELWTTPTCPRLKDQHCCNVGAPIQAWLILAPSPHLEDLCPCCTINASIQELLHDSRIPHLREW
jgi:hypothetical protein